MMLTAHDLAAIGQNLDPFFWVFMFLQFQLVLTLAWMSFNFALWFREIRQGNLTIRYILLATSGFSFFVAVDRLYWVGIRSVDIPYMVRLILATSQRHLYIENSFIALGMLTTAAIFVIPIWTIRKYRPSSLVFLGVASIFINLCYCAWMYARVAKFCSMNPLC